MEITTNREDAPMATYAVLYSYPTWDRYYRGQRSERIEARSEQDAIRRIRKGEGHYGPCPDAQIVRIRESKHTFSQHADIDEPLPADAGTVKFTADGTEYTATLGEPIAEPTTKDAMVRMVNGSPYQIFILLGGGFLARQIVPAGQAEADNACDECGADAELYHYEPTGAALCDSCTMKAEAEAEKAAKPSRVERNTAAAEKALEALHSATTTAGKLEAAKWLESAACQLRRALKAEGGAS